MPAAFYTVQGKPVLALSGNPFACVVTFELLGRQILAAMSGDDAMRPVCQQVALQEAQDKARPIRRFFSGTVSNGTVWMAEAQQNGKTHMLVNSNCIVELPAGNEPLAAG
ncbi:MAG: molybdopterin molybdenumtransferase MoeA, partial [Clostridia bacterium]|nr:molybdopterin molybdenumtransferase MoeA [Clostridia bacterium]